MKRRKGRRGKEEWKKDRRGKGVGGRGRIREGGRKEEKMGGSKRKKGRKGE